MNMRVKQHFKAMNLNLGSHCIAWKGGKKANAVNPRGYIPFPHN